MMATDQSTALVSPESDPKQRSLGIGGSDVAAILGLSPYKTALDLYLEKRGLWEDEYSSEAAHWGNIMEPVLAGEYVRRYETPLVRSSRGIPMWIGPGDAIGPDMDVYRGPAVPLLETLTHPDYPWARGHVDGIGLAATGDPSHVCEFKTADLRLAHLWGEPDTDQIPEPYLVQVQWYLMLTDLEVSHVAALIGGNRFVRYIIERDETLIRVMLEHAAAFWAMVERGEPPAPEQGERGKQSLSRLYPDGTEGKEIDATPNLLLAAEELHMAREAIKSLEERRTTIENDIKLVMGDAVRLNLGPKSYIGWKNNKDSKKTDWEAAFNEVASELFDRGVGKESIQKVIAAHTTTKPGPRVFRCQGLDKLERV